MPNQAFVREDEEALCIYSLLTSDRLMSAHETQTVYSDNVRFLAHL